MRTRASFEGSEDKIQENDGMEEPISLCFGVQKNVRPCQHKTNLDLQRLIKVLYMYRFFYALIFARLFYPQNPTELLKKSDIIPHIFQTPPKISKARQTRPGGDVVGKW